MWSDESVNTFIELFMNFTKFGRAIVWIVFVLLYNSYKVSYDVHPGGLYTENND